MWHHSASAGRRGSILHTLQQSGHKRGGDAPPAHRVHTNRNRQQDKTPVPEVRGLAESDMLLALIARALNGPYAHRRRSQSLGPQTPCVAV